MKVYAFIDTNVLLHYRFLREVDWAGVAGVRDAVLVFAPVVLGELDQHKWSGSRREKARARSVLKILDELGLSTAPVCLRPRVSVVAVSDEPDETIFAKHRLQASISDDRLVASLLAFRDSCGNDDRVVLLSADAGLRVKARARQIELVVPDDSLANDDEPDEIERQLTAANRELAALRRATPVLRLTIGGRTRIECEVQPVRRIDARTLRRLLDEWRAKYPHISEKLSNVVDRPRESGGVLLRLSSSGLRFLLHAVDEAHAGAHER